VIRISGIANQFATLVKPDIAIGSGEVIQLGWCHWDLLATSKQNLGSSFSL
jgi:hypothetical protein